MEALHLHAWETTDRQSRPAPGRRLRAARRDDPDAAAPAAGAGGGVHPVHFRIIMAVNLSIGMYRAVRAQPVRLAGDLQQPLATIYRGVIPFVLINFLT
jgi:hypothetical protein